MNKNPVITEQTKQNLMEAFWSFYKQKRIEKISVKEITEKAGYNRGTFYVYFRDVYEVLQQIEIQSLPTISELPKPIVGNPDSSIFIESFMGMYQAKFKYYNVLLGENGDPSFQRKLKDSIKKILIDILPKMSKEQKMETDFILEYILSGMIGIMLYAFQKKSTQTPVELAKTIYGFMKGDMMEKLKNILQV